MTLIGVVGPMFDDSFADNLVSSVHQMGLSAVSLGSAAARSGSRMVGRVMNIATQLGSAPQALLQRQVLRAVEEHRPDVVITVESVLLPSTVEKIGRSSARVVLWFPDHVANLGRQLMLLAPYDLVCFKDPVLVSRLQAMLEVPLLYLPEACNPQWHRPPPSTKRERVVVVAGNMYASRVRLLERLVAAGIPLRLYGPPVAGWLRSPALSEWHTSQYIARDTKAAVFRSAAAVLNTLHPGELSSMNCRLFEAAGCGATVLTEWRDTLPTYFDPESEVVAFRTFDELVERIQDCTDEPARGLALGDRASARAHSEHTYSHRLSSVLERVL